MNPPKSLKYAKIFPIPRWAASNGMVVIDGTQSFVMLPPLL